MSDAQKTIFLLGATGYLGSQFLFSLGCKLPQFHVLALVRDLNADKEAKLKAIYEDLEIIEGCLDDSDKIKDHASKAKYVINCASSDHAGCVESVLAGLGKQSATRPGDPPLYIHVSGLGIVNDNARGEHVDEDKIPRYTDIGFSPEQCPPGAPHMNCDKVIAAAGIRSENPVRTVLAYPGWIYGIGEGIERPTAAIRVFLNISKPVNFAGTWGSGHNSMACIHVKDAASALLAIFEAALQGKADEGAEGHYFLATDEPYVPFREITKIIGDVMFNKGIYSQGGTQPLPPIATDALGEFGWLLMAGNNRVDAQRLKRLGWEPTETRKISLLDSLPREVELAIQEQVF